MEEWNKVGWFGRELGEGAKIPRGWGVAYRYWDRLGAVIMPIPLNVVVALARRFYVWLRIGVAGRRWGFESRWDKLRMVLFSALCLVSVVFFLANVIVLVVSLVLG